ncbi:MAG: hypothetical protein JNL56_06540 [Alphaproteobacteria bacterium]|nr:hypothetical protein [Alphaproteobacteria bacterium]
MPDIEIVERGVTLAVRGVDEPGAIRAASFPSQQAQIEDALALVPVQHLGAIPEIWIGNRPASGGGFYRNPPHIGLNRRTFDAEHNRRHLFTLLHEIGHAVDRQLHAVTQFQHRCTASGDSEPSGAEWTLYRAIAYGGRNRRADGTPAYGEHFAEGYAILLTRPSRITTAQQRLIRTLARLA